MVSKEPGKLGKLKSTAGRILASAQIAGTVGTSVPLNKNDLPPNLAKQYGQYSANVRAPQTRRDIQRHITKSTEPSIGLNSRDRKNIRKKK
ncbi:hypothetical protein ABKW28_16610 [Nocardioides sp. 31GB23]|uniref:hypothetical protein n=1 Tax=Nocardioides sp. 31GB23 TaxID=3156065 RepID=UPI0032AF2F5A